MYTIYDANDAVVERGFVDLSSARRYLHMLSVYRGAEVDDYNIRQDERGEGARCLTTMTSA